jgi:hypothetical protein
VPPGAGRPPLVVPSDYDTDPGRFAANLAIRQCFAGGDVFAAVAQRLTATPAASLGSDLVSFTSVRGPVLNNWPFCVLRLRPLGAREAA